MKKHMHFLLIPQHQTQCEKCMTCEKPHELKVEFTVLPQQTCSFWGCPQSVSLENLEKPLMKRAMQNLVHLLCFSCEDRFVFAS